MSKRLLASSLLLAGCVGTTHEVAHVGGNVRITDGIRGGEAYVNYAVNGIGISAALTGDRYKRPVFDGEQQRFGGGIDFGVRASLFGLAKQNAIAHWFDLGAALGGGGGLIYPARLATYAEGWVGGWMTIGLPPGHGGYPSLVFDIRRQAVTEWNNETLFSIGLAFTRRISVEHSGVFAFH